MILNVVVVMFTIEFLFTSINEDVKKVTGRAVCFVSNMPKRKDGKYETRKWNGLFNWGSNVQYN